MAQGRKYEAYKISYSIMRDTGGSQTPTNYVTVLMDAQNADAERAIQEVKKHLIQQGQLQQNGDAVDGISPRRLKVHEAVKQTDLGETIIID